jgi:creatinine amidohydrolase
MLLPPASRNRSAAQWAHLSTTLFSGPDAPDQTTLCILPIYSFADHGIGLALDLEEIVGTKVLGEALQCLSPATNVRILPPVRFSLIPYGLKLGALDPETAHSMVTELRQSIARAGHRKLVFWVASPWNSEFIDTASRDARIEGGIQSFVVEFAGVGLNLHPAANDRSAVQAIAAHLLGSTPTEKETPPPQLPSHGKQRPGDWSIAPTQGFDASLDPQKLLRDAGLSLASLLSEIDARAPLGLDNHAAIIPPLSASEPRPAPALDPSYRRRYLPAWGANALAQLPEKSNGLVIIPIGAIEQHGPHLPVVVDALLAEAAALAIDRLLPAETPVWFGPTITFGKSNEHHTFPGTLSISASTLRRIIMALATQLKALGFRHIALLNTHGGNSAVIDYTLREIQSELDLRVDHLRIPSTSELSAQESTWGFHAGEWETSLMLALAPELVEPSKALCHYPAYLSDRGKLRPESAPAIFSWQTSDIAPAGVMGDATAATVEKGNRWFSTAMEQLAAYIRSII